MPRRGRDALHNSDAGHHVPSGTVADFSGRRACGVDVSRHDGRNRKMEILANVAGGRGLQKQAPQPRRQVQDIGDRTRQCGMRIAFADRIEERQDADEKSLAAAIGAASPKRVTALLRLIPHFGKDQSKQFDGGREAQLPASFHQFEHIVIQFAPPRGTVLEFAVCNPGAGSV
jgi:hypothetical protein